MDTRIAQSWYTRFCHQPFAVAEDWRKPWWLWLPTVLKYLARAGEKPGIAAVDDLIKARDYLTWEIDRIRQAPAGAN